MKLDNEFTVNVPIEQAWAVLTDLELIAPCMPGAQLTGVTDGIYSGKVKIKVGPITAEYGGTAQFSVKDEAAYRAVIDARGRDSRGNGNAAAVIAAQLQPAGLATVVSVSTDLTIAGRVAQFGSGMIKEVSAKLLGQFVACLEGKLSAGAVSGPALSSAGAATAGSCTPGDTGPAAGAAVPIAAVGGAGADSAVASTAAAKSAAASTAVAGNGTASSAGAGPAAGPASGAAASVAAPGPEPAALDLMSVAGRAIYKRLVPLAAGLVVLAVIIYLIVRYA
jgi:carbon monoxide dehydrogenase subunit G